ncbi:DUF4129 domain-containing protein [Natronoglomus mannanivorans]|uniref:DUF4129 domain-containing protein n=1 Tax=Natronoglomus mannanivorans TaxID=2979990 RepID=UPI0030831E6C
MSQSTLRMLVIGLVCIATIAVGAATITSTVDVGTPDAATDPTSEEIGQGDSGGSGGLGDNESTVSMGTGEGSYIDLELERCNDFLASTPGTLVYFGAIVAVVYLIKRRYSSGAAMISVYGLAPIVLTAYFLGTSCPDRDGRGLGDADLGGDGGGGAGDALMTTPEISPIWLVGVFGILLVAAAAVMIRASGDQTVELEDEDEEIEQPDVRDLAQAAGEAADRLEKHNADVDNAVYRAWWEMTRLLEVPNPDSATPGEFAAAAVDLGIAEDDVDELTTLFEEVRYGKRDPASREQLAIDVFRSIESEYGGGSEADLEGDDVSTNETDETTDTEDR